jgi:hypothetical protein
MRVFFKTGLAAGMAFALLGAAPLRSANPLQLMHWIVGRWNCSSIAGSQRTTYTATYSYGLGGTWLRAVNTSHGSVSEDLLSYSNRTWRIVDVEPSGTVSVLEGPDTGLAHMALSSKYPKTGLNVTFDRRSTSKYTLTFSGMMNGKPAHWQDVCSKG